MNRLSLVTAFAAALVLALAAGSTHAVPINGDLSFTGTFTVNNPNLALATRFNSFSGVAVMSEPAVNNGDYEGTDNTPTTFKPFTFAGPGKDDSVIPLWTFNFNNKTYSFDATSVSVSFAENNALVVEGLGTAHITGFDDTLGFWVITANRSRSSFSFSSSASAEVPEPATLGVAALGVGMMLLRRRRKSA